MPYLRHAIRKAFTAAAKASMVRPGNGGAAANAPDAEWSAHASSTMAANDTTALALSSLKSSAIDWFR